MENQELQLITQRFDSVTVLMNSQFKGINERLDKINGRVGKTEDEILQILVEKGITKEKQDKGLKELDELYVRVDEIDNKERNHVAVCPVVPRLGEMNKRIRILEDTSLATITKKNLIVSAVSMLAVIMTLMLGSIKINESLRVKETNKIMQMNDSIMMNQAVIYNATKKLVDEAKQLRDEKPVEPKAK